MKNLLVDALRQAQEKGDAEAPDTTEAAEVAAPEPAETIVSEPAGAMAPEPVKEASNDSRAMSTRDDLELVEETGAFDVTEFDPDATAAFAEAFELTEPEAVTEEIEEAMPIPAFRPQGFLEHSGAWLPVLCLVLGAAAAISIPLFHAATRGDLGLPTPHAANVADTAPAVTDAAANRFPFIDPYAPNAGVDARDSDGGRGPEVLAGDQEGAGR